MLIIFTSGTQGRPRGAVLTHANCFWTNLALSRAAEITSSDTVLAAHAAVADVAVVGVPDDRWGEVGVAFVVPRAGVATDEDDLLALCASQLAGFKVPHRVVITGKLPRSAANKVLRRALIEQYVASKSETGKSEVAP